METAAALRCVGRNGARAATTERIDKSWDREREGIVARRGSEGQRDRESVDIGIGGVDGDRELSRAESSALVVGTRRLMLTNHQ